MGTLMLFAMVLTLFSGTGQVNSINQNGSFWARSMSDSEKVMYVWGFRDGYEHGYFEGRGDVYVKEGAVKVPKPMTSGQLWNAEHPSTSLSNGDIVRQVDAFYSDYRNMPVCMDDAVKQAIESLKGHPWSDGQLAIYRQSKQCSIN